MDIGNPLAISKCFGVSFLSIRNAAQNNRDKPELTTHGPVDQTTLLVLQYEAILTKCQLRKTAGKRSRSNKFMPGVGEVALNGWQWFWMARCWGGCA